MIRRKYSTRAHNKTHWLNISLPDLENVGILFEHLHWSFDTSKQLSGPSNAAGNGRKIARCCGTALLSLVYNAHLLQVLPIQWQQLHVLRCHVQLTGFNLLKSLEQLNRLLGLKQHRKSARLQTESLTDSTSANSSTDFYVRPWYTWYVIRDSILLCTYDNDKLNLLMNYR